MWSANSICIVMLDHNGYTRPQHLLAHAREFAQCPSLSGWKISLWNALSLKVK